MSAQTGHAYSNVITYAKDLYPERYNLYRTDKITGSKVTLKAKNINQLIIAYEKAIEADIPAVLVVDQEHILPPDFKGQPIITALGIGPCTKEEVKFITKKFQCV